MKKFLVIFICILFGFQNYDVKITISKKYKAINAKLVHAPPIIEFFSFLCPHCYYLERNYHLDDHIKNSIPSFIRITKYHVNLLEEEFNNSLTKIWEISKSLGLEKKVIIPIFEKVQITKTITNFFTLKNEFLKLTKIDAKEFDFLWNSFVIKSIIHNQKIIQDTIHLDHVPYTLINGKYTINNENINNKSKKDFIKEYIHILKFLLNEH
ncbi:DsbA family protein [Buchnera aphidicola]|uniref:Thiol:disulfide interchange protein n=1 Tax=Buchnera aphidicola subsp. Melaphis rhois TaxID=118103 RepID=A0A4D6Y1A3_BUCMH|nr:DsbA family protein [Buchnera aphidicola]QCI23392.1 hypothetical protein D9V73_01965 [Buchnera aphidicola (Melaphis rhois)]